jgi:translation initiation factor IF-1
MRKDDVFSSAAKSQACPLACHIEILPDARYRVQLDAAYEVVAYTSGKMKKNRIKTLAGDRVIIEMSPYALHKGRLVFRHKDERSATGPRPP